MKRSVYVVLGAATLLLGGCVTPSGEVPGESGGTWLTTDIADSGGRILARANIAQRSNGIAVRVSAMGLSPGTYAAHVHAVGRCDGPGFTSAGAHWNPTGRQHGKDNPAGMHQGDMPNLMVGADGRGSFEFTIRNARITGGTTPLLDTDGAAVVIHASPDDHRTDPAGNAGSRIACGLLG